MNFCPAQNSMDHYTEAKLLEDFTGQILAHGPFAARANEYRLQFHTQCIRR
jgi:hypothetical protein